MLNKHYFGTWFFPWLLANIIGQALGTYIGIKLGVILKTPDISYFVWLHVTRELILGIFQWIVIRKFARVEIWLLSSLLIGLTYMKYSFFYVFIAVSINSIIPALGLLIIPISFMIAGTIMGAITGICQKLAFTKRVSKSMIWLPVNMIAYGLGHSIVATISFNNVTIKEPELLSMIFSLLGLIAGTITGITLEWLMEPTNTTS